MNKPIYQWVMEFLSSALGYLGMSKTEVLGAVMVILPVLVYFKVMPQEWADWIISVLPEHSVITGLGLITVRDAMRKIQNGSPDATRKGAP